MVLTILTIVVSLFVPYSAYHQFFSTVKMPVLRSYGGITFEDLQSLELWRVVTSRFIHAKQAHSIHPSRAA